MCTRSTPKKPYPREFFFRNPESCPLFSSLPLQGPNPKSSLLLSELRIQLNPQDWLFLPEGKAHRMEQHLLSR